VTSSQDTDEKKDFFVSYSSPDKEWAEWIAFQLEAHNHSTVLQAWDWGPGSNFIFEMQKAARTCERTILVLSPAFLEAIFTQPEWAQAFRRDPTGEKRILIPIRIQECELEGFFGPLVYIDFLAERPPEVPNLREHLIDLLLDGIQRGRRKPNSEPPVPAFRIATEDRRTLSREAVALTNTESLAGHLPDRPRTDNRNVIFGQSRKTFLESLDREWLQTRRVVALMQGFPGTGKTQIASSIGSDGWIIPDPVQVGVESEDRETDLFMDLASSLEIQGVDELAQDLAKGGGSNPLEVLRRVIAKKKVLLIIDEFQRFFPKEHTCPPDNWQEFIEKLNNSPASEGKVLLISNRIVMQDRWNEGCVVKELQSLPDKEAADFFLECLLACNVEDRVPRRRLTEVARRLGGNPRALKTLVASLIHFSIDELLSELPEELETGDVSIDSQLLERFEHGLISRAIDRLSAEEIQFMRCLAVNRQPIGRSFYSTLTGRYPDWKRMRSMLIDRFLIDARNDGDAMHPLAREIAVTRLREDREIWQSAHSCAADYHLELFRFGSKGLGRQRAASFVEVRHHLFEAGRLRELSDVSARMRSFVLSRVPMPTLSKVPRTTEILEEHIVLIESLRDDERSKGLDYHLALCLKERNRPGDYDKALEHARVAVGPGVYYSVWLLLADLEFSLNGAEAMMGAARRALSSLGSGSNAFAIYHHCADLLDKDGRTEAAIAFLENAIRTSGVQCKSSLVAMCVRFLEQVGDTERANGILARELEGGKRKEEGVVFAQWASMLISQGKPEEAVCLLDRAISREGITKLFSLYLIKARALVSVGKAEAAMVSLREGIVDKRVIDPVELFRELAKLLAIEGKVDEAVELLESAVTHKSIRNTAPLFHSTAGILEKAGEYDLGAKLLGRALRKPELQNDPTIYLACAKMHFRARDLEKAEEVLRLGLGRRKLRERNQIIVKLAEIIHRREATSEAIAMLSTAIDEETDPRHIGKIYQYCSELLEGSGDLVGAENVLRRGLDAPAISDKNVLVQGLAKNLAKQKRPQEAVDMLLEAVRWPGISGIVILYQSCAKILATEGRIWDAIKILREGMENKTIGNLGSLFTQCGELLASVGKLPDAIELVRQGIKEFPNDQSLKQLLGRLTQQRRR